MLILDLVYALWMPAVWLKPFNWNSSAAVASCTTINRIFMLAVHLLNVLSLRLGPASRAYMCPFGNSDKGDAAGDECSHS